MYKVARSFMYGIPYSKCISKKDHYSTKTMSAYLANAFLRIPNINAARQAPSTIHTAPYVSV